MNAETIGLMLFKPLALIIMGGYVFYAYEMNRQSGYKSLAPKLPTLVMKFSALGLAACYLIGLYFIKSLNSLDWLALGVNGLGLYCTASAKIKLKKEKAFTWTGYALEKPRLVKAGIYSVVRHPLYLGVYLTEIGCSVILLRRYPLWFPESWPFLLGITLIVLLYAVAFNATLSHRESKYLESVFGDDYRNYRQEVPALIPISLFKGVTR